MVDNTTNSSSSRQPPTWTTYQEGDDQYNPGLYILNSLTRQKDLFIPITGRQIKLYACGPTVYDDSHMGHARTYLSLDIIRRILTKYFNYDVMFVMNITDIDDKIIKRARQNHLYEKYKTENENSYETVLQDVKIALKESELKLKTEADIDKKNMLTIIVNEINQSIANFETNFKIDDNSESFKNEFDKIINKSKSFIADWLDNKYGETITNHSIFSILAKEYEDKYFNDMESLNIKPPNILTRVSEYIPEIIEYIQAIINNGYGYQTNDGSVYFDTMKFQSNEKHFYAKLVPEAYGDRENEAKHMKESEGELSLKAEEKKNSSDFALWKSSKKGEPFWDSPWGKGRPGWHIECSAMSTSICGKHLDIHAGGFDLKFPHHDNEIAQSEAYFNNSPWVNYFLHCGTLRIFGSKMSKSFKNFITIKDALQQYTSKQLRILFLMHNWNDTLNYSDETMKHACHFEKEVNEFFLLIKDIIRKKKLSNETMLKYEQNEFNILEEFEKIKNNIHQALCDSFDTKTVIEKIRLLVKICNKYIKDTENNNSLNSLLLINIGEYITDLLKIFGVIDDSNIGFSSSIDNNFEEQLMPILDAFAEFRKEIKNIAIQDKNKEILNMCDKVRDNILPSLGVRLEDNDNETRIKLDNKLILLNQREKYLKN